MTLPQLFEMRYSKGVRILAGVICAFAGILNMAIFPIVAGRFFTYFGGLPTDFTLLGITLPTIPVLTAFLIGAAITFAFLGGQVSVIVTDFIQAVMMSFMFVAVGYCIFRAISWDSISHAITSMETKEMEKLINPFTSGGRFGWKYFLFGIVGMPFGIAAWPTGMNKVMAANSPKDARLIMLFKNLRLLSWAGIAYAGFAVISVMNLPEYSHYGLAEAVSQLKPSIQNQMAGPILLSKVLPAGIMGLMFAGMMSAFISTNDSYMLTWGNVIVQDIIYPLRKEPLPRKQHIRLLRITVLLVGAVIFIFGVLYKPSETIWEFQLLSGAIYMSGAGTIITFALYWRRGTKYGAYGALIVGASLPILNRIFEFASSFEGGIITYLAAPTTYVILSLLTKNPHFDLEKMLNRPPREKKGKKRQEG